MGRVLRCAALIVTLGLSACATEYGTESLWGGYDEAEVSPGVWTILFAGNGYTTRETVQAFWLYRAAELTMAHGYSGFEVVSDIHLVSAPGPMFGAAEADEPVRLIPVSEGTTFLPEGGAPIDKPFLRARIRMLHSVLADPPHVFDAAALKAALEPVVKGPLCGGNVCPHVHLYLRPPLRA